MYRVIPMEQCSLALPGIAPDGFVPFPAFQEILHQTQVPEPTGLWRLEWDSNRLFRSLEVYGQEGADLGCQIAHDLAATHSEVVDDSYPSMVARKYRREFDLIANVLPLFRHSGALRRHWFQVG
jgi:hypothetical protein